MIYTQENVVDNVVCKMATILFRPQCVNKHTTDWIAFTLVNDHWREQGATIENTGLIRYAANEYAPFVQS